MKKVYIIMCAVTALGMLLSGAAHAVRYADVIDGYSMQLDQNGVMANHKPGFSQGVNDMLIIAVGPGGGGKAGPGGGSAKPAGKPAKQPAGKPAKQPAGKPAKQPSAGGNQRDAKDDARDTRRDAKDDARDTRRDAKDDARDTRRDAKDDARDTRRDVRDDVRDEHRDHHDRHVIGAVLTVKAFSALTCTRTTVVVGGVTYTSCGGTWYKPSGNTYIVVNAPEGH